MVVPALIYAACTWHDPATVWGWAIPTATDIAFALGILTILGSRAPTSLKVFLTALAILNDLGAMVIATGGSSAPAPPDCAGLQCR
jgi:NhaA family Na+:H+ antiporter